MSGAITTLLTSGLDAFTNLYDVRITLPTGVTGKTGGGAADTATVIMSVRANSFTPPELYVGEYAVDYKAVNIKRPNTSIEGERKFSIEFRVDAEMNLIADLTAWKNLYVNPNGDGAINFGALSSVGDLSDLVNYGKVEVVAYNASTSLSDVAAVTSDKVAAKWTFNQVMCMKIGAPVLSRDGADPMTITAEFLFGTYTPPTAE